MGRTILVTGGAGFIGANLARLLEARGDRLRVLDDLSIGHRRYLEGVSHELVVGRVGERAARERAVAGADAVVHLAARAGVADSVADPLGTLDANVSQTVALLESAREAGIRRFVFASSNAAAGEHDPPADETDLPHPVSPYGASKLSGEAYCQAYAATYGMAACALRFSNAYGPFSLHKRSVVASWLRAALADEPIAIHGDGEQTRDFVFAADLAAAIAAALDAGEERVAGEVFCVGTGAETSINRLFETLAGVLDRPLRVERGHARGGDIRRNVSDVGKAAATLGYRAQYGLVEGLAETARWFATALADRELAAIRPHVASGSE